jgi:ribonuclease P protein component
MKKIGKLRKRQEFVKVYSSGRSLANELGVIYWLKNEGPVTRVGFSANKKLGKAVIRNRMKRLFKEAFRLNSHKVIGGMDIVFVVRRSAVGRGFSEVEPCVLNLLRRAGLLIEES